MKAEKTCYETRTTVPKLFKAETGYSKLKRDSYSSKRHLFEVFKAENSYPSRGLYCIPLLLQ
jgi:hypothetical protein